MLIEDINTQKVQEHFIRPVKINKIERKPNAKAQKKLFLENNFMRINRQISKQKVNKSVPPKLLYLTVEAKFARHCDRGLVAPKGRLILLAKTTTHSLTLVKDTKQCHILKVDSAQMYKNGIKFIYDYKSCMWCTEHIPGKYITCLI